MATTAAAYADVAKEVFDSNTLNKMFYDENPFLDRLEKKKRVIIGKRAQVPLHTQRAGGTSVLGAAGGTLNTAGAEVVDRAEYNLAYTWFPVQIEFGALNEISGGAQSVGEAQEHMVSSAVNNIRNQVTRQVLTGDGLVAQCTTTNNSNVVNLIVPGSVSAGRVSGVDAIQAGWLVPGDVIDIGTTSDHDSVLDGEAITAVTDSLTAPSVTVTTAITTTSSHFVSLHNVFGAAGTGTLVESSGLKDIAGTTSNTVGTLDGSSLTFWNPAEVDSTSTLLDLDLLLRLSRRVLRRKGSDYTYCVTSYKQLDAIYAFLQTQVRFNEDIVRSGNSASTKYRDMEIHAFPQVPENVFYFLTLEDLELVFGAYDKPTWASEVEGSNRGAVWGGNTAFSDAIVYSLGLAARRRNSHAAAVNLNA